MRKCDNDGKILRDGEGLKDVELTTVTSNEDSSLDVRFKWEFSDTNGQKYSQFDFCNEKCKEQFLTDHSPFGDEY
jgi:hypothetical protein